MGYKIVAMPIKVPDGKYCWDLKDKSHPICPHYDNEGACDTCDLGFSPLVWEGYAGVLKPVDCLKLKEV